MDLSRITSATSAYLIRKYCLRCDEDEELDECLIVLNNFIKHVTEKNDDIEYIQMCILDESVFDYIRSIIETRTGCSNAVIFLEIGTKLRAEIPKFIEIQNENLKKEKMKRNPISSDSDESELSIESDSNSYSDFYSIELSTDSSFEEDQFDEYEK